MQASVIPLGRATSRREFLGAGAAAGAAFVVFGCGSSEPASKGAATTGPQTGGQFVLGTPQPIETLDPHQFGIYNNRNAWPGLYQGLTRYDASLTPKPDLAQSWETSDDGRTWTFKLVDAPVKFHDGRALTAADVKYSIERILDPETAAGIYAAAIKEVDQVEAVDDKTVRIVLKQPSAVLLSGLARVMIVPEGAGKSLATEAIGTGPWKLAKYAANDTLELERFPDYWEEGKPYLDGVTIRTVPDTTALFTSLTSGGVDAYWQLEPKFAEQLKDSKDLEPLFADQSAVVTYMSLDNGSAPFNQLEARQALLYALDTDTINDLAFFGTAKPTTANSFLPTEHWGRASGLEEYAYDPERARELFSQAGVTELTYVALNIVPWTTVVGEVLERSLAEIGVKLTIRVAELGEWSAAFNPHPKPGVIVANTALPDYDPAFIWALADPDVNPWRFDDAAFADLLAQGRATLDIKARTPIYQQIDTLWNEQVPIPVLCHDRWFHGLSTRINGVVHQNSGDLDYREAWVAG